MAHFVVVSDPGLSHSRLHTYAVRLAQYFPARLTILPAGGDGATLCATVRDLQADLLLVGFTPLPGNTDESRTAHVQPLVWDCPCPLLLVPNVATVPFTFPRGALLLSDGRPVATNWNVTLANQLLRRWQPLTTVLHWQRDAKRQWTLGPVMENLQAATGLLGSVADVESRPISNARLVAELTAAIAEQRANLLVFLPRQKQSYAPLSRLQKLAILLNSPVPVLVVSNS